MNKNIETFIGCDAEYEDASLVLFGAPLTAPPVTVRAPGTAPLPYGTKASDWKPIARIRTKT